MKRRIAMCLEYPLLQHGGVEILVQQMLRGLADFYDIILVSGDKNGGAAIGPFSGMIAGHIYWDANSASHASGKRLAETLVAEKVELAHFHFGGVYCWSGRIPGKCPVIACARAGIPLIKTVHLVERTLEGFCGPQKPLWFKGALWPAAWLSRLQILLHGAREFTVSDHDLRRMQRWFPLWKNRLARVYHSRIEEAGERPLESSKREPILLNVGTIGRRKGQPFLIRAFARIAKAHPGWKLVLVGRANDDFSLSVIREEIARADLGDQLIWMGAVSDEEIVDLMYRASVFVMPSLEEGLGLSLQEALYRGCPAVGSRVGGIPELIDHNKNGLLVSPGSVDELASALECILSDDPLRLKLAAEARSSIIRKGMTQEQMLANYRQIYDSILPR